MEVRELPSEGHLLRKAISLRIFERGARGPFPVPRRTPGLTRSTGRPSPPAPRAPPPRSRCLLADEFFPTRPDLRAPALPVLRMASTSGSYWDIDAILTEESVSSLLALTRLHALELGPCPC